MISKTLNYQLAIEYLKLFINLEEAMFQMESHYPMIIGNILLKFFDILWNASFDLYWMVVLYGN